MGLLLLSILSTIFIFLVVPSIRIYRKKKIKEYQEEYEKDQEKEDAREYHLNVIRFRREFKEKYDYISDHFRSVSKKNGWDLYKENGEFNLNSKSAMSKKVKKLDGRILMLERLKSRYNMVNKSSDIYMTHSIMKSIINQLNSEFKEELIAHNRDKRLEKILNK